MTESLPPSDIPDLPEWYHTNFDEYCLEVGRLSAIWANHENEIDRIIWELLDVEPNLGMCLTAQMIGPGPRVRALSALAETRGASEVLIADLLRFGKDTEELGAKRNRYAHDVVRIGTTTGIIRKTEITANKKLRYVTVKIDIGAIRKLWIEIQQASVTVRNLRKRLIYELPAWKRTRFAQSVANQLGEDVDRDFGP